jgi:hypothetical protein
MDDVLDIFDFFGKSNEEYDTSDTATDVLICLAVAEQRKHRQFAKENQHISLSF